MLKFPDEMDPEQRMAYEMGRADGSHTHARQAFVIAPEDPAATVIHAGRDTLGIINGHIHRFHGLFWREDERGTIGCHSLNCTVHEHWEPL